MNWLELLRSKPTAVVLIAISLLCLYPGLTSPMMSLEVATSLPIVGEIEIYNQTQSIWSGIVSLYNKGYLFVSFLIFLFSVAIPLIKLLSLAIILLFENTRLSQGLHQFVLLIGKWSMADVFVVGIFIAFLAGEANPNMHASLHEGFYWFLAYCLTSILCGQLLRVNKKSYNNS